MNACDSAAGCIAALFKTGANLCYFIGANDSIASNSTYNI